MFERFSVRALQVMFHARSEVSLLGSSAVEPEHILFGLLDEGQGLAGRILARTGASLEQLRNDIGARVTGRDRLPESADVPFSASCMRVLQGAADEADRLSHDSIGTEHLLLGLLREEESAAVEVLAASGLGIASVREAIVELLGRGGRPEPPGPPPSPANSYQWPQIPFAPSPTVHILHSGMRAPQPPAINHAGAVFGAYGFTLEAIIVRAWEGSRWHVDITPGLGDDARFDFLMVLPQEETTATCLGLLRSAIEQHFAVDVTCERRLRDVHVLTHTDVTGRMLRRYPDPDPGSGSGVALVPFSAFSPRSPDTPIFPLDPFTVHSLPFFLLVKWLEEILGREIIDDARLPGIYGFALTERVDTPEALVRLLRDEAGLVIMRQQREVPTIVVRQRNAVGRG